MKSLPPKARQKLTLGKRNCAIRLKVPETRAGEGIVSKRRNSPYKSGTSLNWLKFKNPQSAAALREASEDWAR